MTKRIEQLKEYVYCKGEYNEVRVMAFNKSEAKEKIQAIIDERLNETLDEMYAFYEIERERERVTSLDWQSAYERAIEALRYYNPSLADEIDKDMK